MSTRNRFIPYQGWCWFCLAKKKRKRERKYMSEKIKKYITQKREREREQKVRVS